MYETGSAPAPDVTQTLTEPFHGDIPFSQWRYFAKYLPNSPGGGSNVAVSTQHKMFFSQDGGNFVCSSSTIGLDGVWTAGHCVSDGSGTFSTNVLFCPSCDNVAANPTAGCWGAEQLSSRTSGTQPAIWTTTSAAPTPPTPGTVNAGLIGSFTGVLGFAYIPVAEGTTAAANINYVAFGYPRDRRSTAARSRSARARSATSTTARRKPELQGHRLRHDRRLERRSVAHLDGAPGSAGWRYATSRSAATSCSATTTGGTPRRPNRTR